MEVEGHLNAVTNESPAKSSPHSCDLCGRTFPFLSALTKHMLKHTEEKHVKAPTDAIKLDGSLGQTMEMQEEQEEGQREEEVKKKEEEVEGEEEEKEGGVPEEQEGCSSPTESTSACNRVVNGGEKDAVKSQRKGTGRKERSNLSPCPLRQRKLRSQTEQERNTALPEELFTCQLCGFEAPSKEQLQTHEEKVHLPSDALAGGEGSPEEGAPEGDLTQGVYPCGQCDQVFTQAWLLKAHMKKHQGPLDHGCRICGRRFREPWFLRSHMKTHVIRAKPKAGDSEAAATINGVVQEEAVLLNDACLYELCAKCGNFFQDRQTLWLHEQVHERVRGHNAEKENEPVQSNSNDSNTPVSKKAFLECLNLRPAGSVEKPPEEHPVNRIPELDPISSYQAWQLATRGRVVEATEHSLGWEERLADADVAFDREKGEYVLLKQEKRKKQLVVTPSSAPSATKKKRPNNGTGEKNGHGSSGDVSPESHSDSEYRPTSSNSRRASQNKTSECLECGKGFRSQQQMVIHMLIRHGGGSGFGAGLESSAPIFGETALSFLKNAAFKDQKLAGQTKDSDKKPPGDRHSASKHSAGSSSSHQQGSALQSDSTGSTAASLSLVGESADGLALEPGKQDGLVRHRCQFCTHSTLFPEVLWIHQRVAHKVNCSSPLAPKWALRNGLKGPRSTLEFRRRTGPPPFLEGKDCPAMTETRKPRTQPPQPQSPAGSGSKTDRTSTSESSPSRNRGHPNKASASSSSSSTASNPSSKPKTSSSSGSRKRAADAPPASSPSGNPKKPSAVPNPKTASRAAESSLLPQEGLHFVLASQHGHEEQGKVAVAPSSQRREDTPATVTATATASALAPATDSPPQNSSRRAPEMHGSYPGDASQLDILSFLKNCSPTELAALYHHWGLGTTAMLDQAGMARSLFQQMKYVCPVCGKSFSQPSHYRTHMRSHTVLVESNGGADRNPSYK
ncbi:zinc finger protein 516 isoform X2 [Clupea harengus]|uniref:Zinc finger protein 516 isoform X2 n=1 Tax=Clupea harengus TaxID=7950 RepID=A0A6P8H1H2_CLUHA|nr:zinc finger protein 516 isoform X2 [Clupea harengus]